MDLHIDDFYRDAAVGLNILYQAFPRKIALYIDDIIGYHEPDEVGLPQLRHQQCLSTLLWLADEGFIRYESLISFTALDQACLTAKAFTKLNALTNDVSAQITELPHSIARVKGNLVNQLREAIQNQDSERLALLFPKLLSNSD